MIYEIKDGERVKRLFEGWEETCIWSCLQGIMGHIYADGEEPASAMAVLGDFCFPAGKPDRELLLYKPEGSVQDFIVMVPQNREWSDMIEAAYGSRARRAVRYAIKKEQGIFDREYLKGIAESLPAGFELRGIDRELYGLCMSREWSADLVAQYASYEEYRRLGLGFAAVKDGEIVSGASSYSSYREGIEIEIDTREDCRRRGLALACGARLILECLDRGLYPSWDAHNRGSVALAEKLGYHFSHEYEVYEIEGY